MASPNSLGDRLSGEPEAEWVRKMLEYFRETGQVRPEDLLRILGDPMTSAEIGPSAPGPQSLMPADSSDQDTA